MEDQLTTVRKETQETVLQLNLRRFYFLKSMRFVFLQTLVYD